MKIRPVILCGGSGTRLWPNSKNYQAKQFIDFGKWTLLDKTLERTKSSIYDPPIISTNIKYLDKVKQHLKKNRISKYKIVVEPVKRNTAPAILSTALVKGIPNEQPLMFLAADHLIEKVGLFNKAIKKNQKKLTQNNIFIFGIKPTMPSSEFGYFLTRNNKVSKFVEKPKEAKAKQIISKKGYWNSGMFYLRKDSIINNFKKYQPNIYRNCYEAVTKAKYKSNVYYLNKQAFTKASAKSFDYAILEKIKDINAIKLDIPLV
jgi:mannose-1-phosphate guanylyltransferase/mannose-6-phosphate isomerase